ncbi:LRR receptor kinase BAK1-like isoform X2 [Rhodamnia argentea]|uniref:LRR receptor kinase BAK1-like isoform X1 n=1 Tax=Rhodamnia argentea TaxID=178133 RepID=A0ABM3GS79_9MYRT|nr:LRR receptor kinase BAK1-like isoform X1 [Rhodamnia argentea]XP_048127201.1 LRR receptor kinase BAK1-like isoform X2 [Rhodamnia argentea]
MVFKFATFDPAQDPDDFNPAFPPTPSSSPSATLCHCQPCQYTRAFTRDIVSCLVAAGASLVFTAPAVELASHEIRDRSVETPLPSISSDVGPEFHQRQVKEFTLEELKVATDEFNEENIIGRGGFGKVYKGRLADGSLVAFKRCKEEQAEGSIPLFEAEVIIGSIVPPHQNLLPMLGFCRTSKGSDLWLVYPLMINRDAALRLRERPATQTSLDWPTRIKIAVGAARGLSHLHDLNIVHRDIKAANIMLDEEFERHIGDFGLALSVDLRHGGYSVDGIEEAPVIPRNESKAGSDSEFSHVTTAIRGTMGHIAPEYFSTGKCTVKNDVFAFGVMLLELLTGQRAFDLERLANDVDKLLLDWVRELLVYSWWEILVDPYLQGAYDEEEMEKFIKLALLCTQLVPRERPSMAQVVRTLEGHGINIEERWEEYDRRFWEEHWGELRSPDLMVADSTSHMRAEELSGPR